MKNRKIVAVLIAVILLLTQFSTLVTVAGTPAALSGRSDFVLGVAIHPSAGFEAYKYQYNAILDAKALGSKLIRTGSVSDEYDKAFASIAGSKGQSVMFHLSLNIAFKEDGIFKTPEEIGYEKLSGVYDRFYAKATALKDFDAYIQISNELDNDFKKDYVTGTSATAYNSVDSVAIAVYLANKAVHDANAANGSNIKTVINFSYNHYGFLDALKAVDIDTDTYTVATGSSVNTAKADFDIVGLDYYSNMYDDAAYEDVISAVKDRFDKDIFICESNLTPTGESGGAVSYAGDAGWLETFIRYCYADPAVKGFIAYELYDEPAYEKGGSFSREAHFGLIDKDGGKKDTYNTVCALYGGTGVVADRTVPEAPGYPADAEVEISRDGVSTFWSSDYISTSDRLCIDFTEAPVNLENFSVFEFDLYIEDYDVFKTAVAGKRINFALSNSDVKTKVRIRFDIEDQITKSGWNHITLKKSARWQCDSGFNYDAVKWIMIFFQDGGDGHNPMSGSKVAMANLCGTKEEIDRLPDWPEYEHVELSRKGKTNWWGSNHPNSNFVVWNGDGDNDITVCDVTGTDQVEFDVYVKDYETFRTNAAGKDLRFCFGSSGGKWLEVHVLDKITHEGWNHVVAVWVSKEVDSNTDRADINQQIDLTAIMQFRLRFNTGGSYTLTNYQARIANVCFTKKEISRIPDWPEYEHVKFYKESGANYWGSGANNSNFLVTGLDPVNMSETEQVEFDIYIANYDSFSAAVGSAAVRFRFGDTEDNYIDVNVLDKITKSGWNHVAAVWLRSGLDPDTDRHTISGDIKLGSIVWLKLYCTVGINWQAGGQTRIANVCFTKKEINRPPEYPENAIVEISEMGVKSTWGAKYNYTVDRMYKATTAASVDISVFDNIEFDIYIKDSAALKAAAQDMALRFMVGSGDSRFVNRAAYNIADKITKDGWNHIVIKKDSPDINEAIDFTSVKVAALVFWNGAGADNPVGGTEVRIVNICSTGLEAPEVTETDRIDFIGSTVKPVRFDVEGIYYSGFDSAKDISSARVVEMDLYAPDGSLSSVTVELADSTGSYALYEFGGLKSGWNHLYAKLSDGVDDDGKPASPDFTDITGYSLYGGQNAQAYAANFYVTSNIKCAHETTHAVEAEPSTCCTQGHGAYTVCDECGAIVAGDDTPLPLDPNNHEGETEVRDAVGATCTAAGYTGDTYCLGCGEKIAEGTATPLAAHTAAEWITDQIGHWHICTECQGKFDEGAHIESGWITDIAATAEAGGHRHKECTVCGYHTAEEDTEKLDSYIPGDINGDGSLNNKDLTRLFQYLSDWDVEVSEAALDINGDGSVNNKDLTRLFQYLSDWDVEIF